jgi:iron complex outermembrane recepter protein
MKKYSFVMLMALFAHPVAGQGHTPAYKLTADTILLGDVTISSSIPVNNSQIEKFYRTNSFSTIDNLTAHLEGVSLIKRGAYAMEPQLNGFSAGELNITIDGIKMFGACTDKMDPVTSYLEPANLKTVTLEHGTNCGLHGNNVGGSIDLALKDPENNGLHAFSGSIMTGYESVSNGRNLLFSAGHSKNKWAWGLNGVYRKNGNYRAGNGERINHSQFEKYNFHSVLLYTADSFSSVRTDILWDFAHDVGYPALPMDVSRARAYLAAAEYKREKGWYDLKVKIYYNSVFHQMDDSGRDSLFFLNDRVPGKRDSVYMRMDMPGRSRTFGGYFQGLFRIGVKNSLTVKIDNYTNSSLAEMTMHMRYPGYPAEPPMYLQTWPDVTRNVSGIFLSDLHTFNNKVSLTVNGRIDLGTDRFGSSVARDQFSVFNYELSRRYSNITKGFNASLRYHILKPLLVEIQSGVSERVPTISERYGFYLYNAYDGYDYVGNPGLRTEKSVSGRTEFTYFRKGLKISLAGSVSLLRDYIMGVTDTTIPPMNFYTNGLRVYSNIRNVKMFSTDLQVLYRLSNGLSFYLLSKYTFGQIGTSAPLPLIPPFMNSVTVSYEWKQWTFQADNETAFRQDRINRAYSETRSPGYSVFNLKASLHLMPKRSMIDVSAGVTNLFNRDYYEHLDWGRIPRPGRSVNILLKYTF